MSPRFALAASLAACFVAAAGCSDDGDDGCPDCHENRGGNVTFPPSVPTTDGPEPMGGSTSTGGLGTGGLGGTDTGGLGGVITGGVGGTDTGGLGGTDTGGLGGTDTGGLGAGGVSPDGGVSGTGAFGNQGGDLTGGLGGTF